MAFRFFFLFLFSLALKLPGFAASVSGNGQVIASGDTTPSVVDDSDFGTVIVGENVVHQFTFKNDAGVITNPFNVALSGPNASEFTIQTGYPGFQVQFVPRSAGLKRATVTVTSGSTITFAIQGLAQTYTAEWTETFTNNVTGFDVPGWSTVALSGSDRWNRTFSSSGSSGYGMAAPTNFSAVDSTLVSPLIPVQANQVLRFMQTITGNGTFLLEYKQEDDTTWSAVPVASINGGLAWTTSNATLTPVDVDLGFALGRSIRIRWRFVSSSFSFSGSPWFVDNVSLRTMSNFDFTVKGNGNAIFSGDTTPRVSDDTAFGNTVIGDTTTHTFTVSYNSLTPAPERGTPTVSITGGNAALFGVSGSPTLSTSGTTTTFGITFTPAALGIYSATVSIAKFTGDPAPYTFAISGTSAQLATVLNETFTAAGGFDLTGWSASTIGTYRWLWNQTAKTDLFSAGISIPAGVFYTAESNTTFPGLSTHTLDSPSVAVRTGSVLSFDQDYFFGTGAVGQENGGILQYTTDGGATWQDVPEAAIEGGYPATVSPSAGASPLMGKPAWTGFRGLSAPPETVKVYLDTFAKGQTIRLRWYEGNGAFPALRYWWIDNVKVTMPVISLYDVTGNDILIEAGDSTPSTDDGTEFGLLQGTSAGFTPITRTFSIASNTTAPLPSSFTITLSGPDAVDFRIAALQTSGDPRTFNVLLDPKSAGSKTATVTVSAGGSSYSFDVAGVVELINTKLTETFEGTNGFDNVGWDSVGAGYANGWRQVSTLARSPTHSFFTEDTFGFGQPVLISPAVVVAANTHLRFYQAMTGTQTRQLYYAVTPFFTKIAIPNSAITGLSTVSPEMKLVDVDLGSFAAGQTIRIFWQTTTASSLGTRGWFIDDVSVLDVDDGGADLADLGVNGSAITPAFTPLTLSYVADGVPHATTSVTVRATAKHDGATIQARVNGGAYSVIPKGLSSSALPLTSAFNNLIEVLVTDADGSRTKMYSIRIFRDGIPQIRVTSDSFNGISGVVTQDFGLHSLGSGTFHSFTISNTGDGTLHVNTPQITGNTGDFTVISPPQANVPPLSSTSFLIRFSAQAIGARAATVTVNSDAQNAPVYQVSLTGTGGQPEIGITWRGVSLASGTSTASTALGTEFGTIGVGSSSIRTFVITNAGNTPLLFPSGIQITGSSAFSVFQPPPSSVAPSEVVEFSLRFTPSATTDYNATVSIANDDLNENPYTFAIHGRGAGPTAVWSDAFTGTDGFDVPGWTHYAINGATDWAYVNGGGVTYWTNRASGSWGDRALVTPAIAVLPGTHMAFIHQYNLDATYCGVVLEYSSDDGHSWLPVPEAAMKNAGYDRVLAYGSVLEGQRGWTGSTGSNVPPEDVDLGSFANGKTIKIRWHAADNFYRKVTGNYNVDNVSVYTLNFGTVSDLAGLVINTTTATQPAPATTLVELDKPFNNLVTTYSGTVFSSPAITVNARLADNTATIQARINAGAYTSIENNLASGAFALNPGYNTLEIRVTANDLTTKTYSVSVYRATAPDITVLGNSEPPVSGGGVAISSGDTTPSLDDFTDFGATPVNVSVTRSFTIRNIGNGPLNLTGNPKVSIAPSTIFTVTTQPLASLVSGAETTFAIRFTPTANGPAPTATVSIGSDDPDEASYTFVVGGFGGIPSNNADLSNIALSTATLAPSFTAANNTYIATSTASSTVITATTANANATVVIRADGGIESPSGTSFILANGNNFFEIVVTAQDGITKRSYYLNVMRTAPPEINVSANGQNILSGDTTPSTADFTDFGNTVLNTDNVRAFRINNTGAGPLLISNVTVSGSTDFSLTVPPITTISSNGQTSFSLRFTPTSLGLKTATVTIRNNDSDEGTYTFAIAGNGFVPSSNADLASLSLRGGTIAPVFNALTLNYTATVPSTVSSVIVDAAAADSGASIVVRMTGALDRAPGTAVDVNFGANRFDVIVTAADRIATRTYTLIVTRNGPPEIAVTGNTQLIASGDATPSLSDFTDFGNVDAASGNVVRTFTIVNSGTGPLVLSSTSLTGSSDFTLTTPPATTIAAASSSTFQVTFDPSSVGLKSATLTITNDDSDEGIYTFAISGTGTVVVPTAPDIAVRFNSLDIPNGTPIATAFGNVNASSGASTRTFIIANVGTAALNLSGTPQVQLTGPNAADFVVSAAPTTNSLAPGAQTSFIVTFDPSSTGAKTATIVIASNDPDEAPFSFAVSGTGTAPSINPPTITKSSSATTYTIDVTADGSWTVFESLTWVSVSAASGTGSSQLTVTLLANATATARTGTITIGGATHTITQNGIATPTLDALSSSYTTTVGLAFNLPIIAQNPPFTFTASGLPPGLRIGMDGVISGQTTTAGTYNVTVRATNIAGSASATFSIVVSPFPATFVGSWTGLVQRIPTPQLGTVGDLGSRLDITSSATGSITGKITEAGTARSFSGQLTLIDASNASLSILIPGTSATLALTFDTSNVATGTLETSAATATVEAWRNVWSMTNPAALYAARHNFGLQNNSGQGPEGYGYGSFTVTAATGALIVSGKLADGTALTTTTFAGPNGEVLVYQSLYLNKGTLHGKLSIDANTAPVADNTLTGTLSWSKPASTTTTDTLYRNGFGPIDLDATGGSYTRPPAGQRVLGVPAVVAPATNARLAFDLGGVTPFDQTLRVINPSATGLTNTVAFATPNPNVVSITSLDPATGLFAGRFTLKGPTTALNRTVTFQGQITTTPSGLSGLGYFILPQLPVAPETLTTSPKLSGSVVFEP